MENSVDSNELAAERDFATSRTDPRLVDLVRLLARDAAERFWEDHCREAQDQQTPEKEETL